MIDIVGTLNQPHLAFIFILLGLITGIVGVIIKTVFSPSRKLTLVLGDLITTIIFFVGYICLSFFKARGVVYAYTLASTALGYALSYFSLKKLLIVIVKTFKKKFGNAK